MKSASLLVLGSASPRRREILSRVGLEPLVLAGDADETRLPGEPVDAYLARVVELKLASVAAKMDEALAARAPVVLVADTSVILGDALLGKPATEEEGRAMIASLSGVTHEVHTRFALAVGGKAPRVAHAETVVSRVTFRPLPREEQLAYVKSGEGTDKAGGYGVQGRASGFVTRIEGSYTNVVGLPAAEVLVALRPLGINVP